MLHRDRNRHHNDDVEQDVEQELAELEAIALRVKRREAANERDLAEIRRRLPGLRAKNVGPARLEQTIHRVYVAGTISRWTVDAAGTGRKAAGTPEPPGPTPTPDGT